MFRNRYLTSHDTRDAKARRMSKLSRFSKLQLPRTSQSYAQSGEVHGKGQAHGEEGEENGRKSDG